MKLLTKQQRQKLIANGTAENSGNDHYPVVKLFLTASGCTWLLTELSADPEFPNLAFGLCDLGVGFPEVGYVDLDEIQELHQPSKLRFLERDRFFEAYFPLSVYYKAAFANDCIVESPDILEKYWL